MANPTLSANWPEANVPAADNDRNDGTRPDAGGRTIETRSVRIAARDGYPLAGTLFMPGQAVRRVVLVVPGTAVPADFYEHFARYLAEAGFAVLTFDYRGVGASRPASLQGFPAALEDWADLDTGGALDWLDDRFPGLPTVALSHSFGGVLVAGTPGIRRVTKIVMVSPHTGYWGDYRLPYRIPMALLWHGLMPLATHLFGYFPAARLRLGQDIPAPAALQWASRRRPVMEPYGCPALKSRSRVLMSHMHDLDRPITMVEVSDDAFATSAGAARVAQLLPCAFVRRITITPAEAGVARLGHFGVFSRRCRATLWPRFADFLR